MESIIRLTVVTTSMLSIGTYTLHICGQRDRIKLFANRIYRWHNVGRYYEQQESIESYKKTFLQKTLQYFGIWCSILTYVEEKQSQTKLNWNKNTEGFWKLSFHFIRKNEKIKGLFRLGKRKFEEDWQLLIFRGNC